MSYTKTVYVNGTTPAINATNLNIITDAIDALRKFPVAGGTGTAITVTDYKFALEDGCATTFIASANNSAAATTLAVNGGAAKSVYKPGGTVAPTFAAGKAYTVWYNAAGDNFFIKASATGTITVNKALAGETLSNEIDTDLVGTMPDRAGDSAAISSAVMEASQVLLHMNGADGSTTFTDESGKTWTVHGNAQIDTAQSKFGGASGLFDGTGDYIDTPDSADFDVGSGDFTIDFWLKMNSVASNVEICGQCDSAVSDTSISVRLSYINDGRLVAYVYQGATNKAVIKTGFTDTTSWHHIAIVRYSNNLYMYFDGTSVDTPTDLSGVTVNNSSNKFAIGRLGEWDSKYFNGYIDEFRILKGIARYIPSFAPNVLLHMNGVDASTTFIDETGKTITYSGTVSLSTSQKKFGNASAYFNGGKILIPSSVDTQFGAANFTIDWWEYRTVGAVVESSFGSISGAYMGGIDVESDTSNNLKVYISSNNATWDIASGQLLGTIDLNTWTHYAITRNGSNFYLFKNGVQITTFSSSSSIYGNCVASIGSHAGAEYLIGYIDEFSVLKGMAKWTANFAPATSEYVMAEYTADLCAGGTPISGGDQDETGAASKAFDGSADSRWSSSQSTTGVSGVAYIGYQFSSAKTIRKITYIGYPNSGAGITSAKLQYYNGSSWIDVITLTLALVYPDVQTFIFANSASSTQWRLLANANPDTWGWNCYELEMMGLISFIPSESEYAYFTNTTLKLLATEGYRDGSNDYVTISDASFVREKIIIGANLFGLAGNRAPDPVHSLQTYSTPGTYSWIVPINVKQVTVIVNGAGGGGSGSGAGGGGGGGAGGSYMISLATTPGETIEIVVGTGGAAGAADAGTGGTGGVSSFSSYSAGGGIGGSYGSAGIGGAGGAGGGIGGVGGVGSNAVYLGYGAGGTGGGAGSGGAGGYGAAGTAGGNGRVVIIW